MDKIIPVQRQQGEGPGDFPYIVSALLPQATLQGLCFLLSCSYSPHGLDLLITLNNIGINIT